MGKSISCSLSILLFAIICFGSELTDSLKPGRADIKSASQLAFGPEGILFIGDSLQGSLFAIATEDTRVMPAPAKLEIKAINEKIAGLLGTTADQILINDVK